MRTNRDGYRGRDYERPKPAGVFRIRVLGDSFTMGLGVPEEQIYTNLLERSLNSNGSETRYEVIYLARSGVNLDWRVSSA